MSLRARGQSRPAWFDRFIVPRETPIAPSRWHQHIEQRRVSRLDHLRPHRLNWEALKNPGAAGPRGRRDADAAAPGGDPVVFYIWLAVRPLLGVRRAPAAPSRAEVG